MVNYKVPHKCWLGKLNKEEGFQGLALSSNGLHISPSPEMCKQTLDNLCGWEAGDPIYPPVHTQMHTNILKAPRSQALEKVTCFGSLVASLTCLNYGIPLSQAPINICKNVVFHGTQFEKHSYEHFGQ